LHAAELISNKHPKGDAGGNDFDLLNEGDNLHAFWDGGVRMFDGPKFLRPLNATDKAAIQAFAKSFTKSYPPSYFGVKTNNFKFMDWANESHVLAVKYAYSMKENTEPTSTYVKNSQSACKRQMALAGYRLANLLNDIWK
jgi:hypothetical protein